ncbi:probable folate-biopterin transporter 2 isoform X2 [Capsella rubella]|uniref:probable folate-biopterin transporter 2 isoform X2 n=1 Tax=Capsella rubella TaxID=81985 RepID=UPI000CD5C5A2|nr:probable folate-biopterin transporter 2 isoform X2 [Capsella rubella]
MEVEEEILENGGSVNVFEGESKFRNVVCGPVRWLKMLALELHWTFLFGVVSIYGINQGFGNSLGKVATEYYMKDVQKVQPSQYQSLFTVTKIPWIIKPLWGILTDVVPIYGSHRGPYFIIAGVLGVVSFLFLSVQSNLNLYLALFWMTISSTGTAIADVTIDACIAYNSNEHPSLAPDMQTFSNSSSSIGALIGSFMSGILLHLVGSKGVFGLLAFPFAFVIVVGILFKKPKKVNQITFTDAMNAMKSTMERSEVWRPSVFLCISFALCLDIHEGLCSVFGHSRRSFLLVTFGLRFWLGM